MRLNHAAENPKLDADELYDLLMGGIFFMLSPTFFGLFSWRFPGGTFADFRSRFGTDHHDVVATDEEKNCKAASGPLAVPHNP